MRWLALALLAWQGLAFGAVYNLSAGQYPSCSTSWVVSGNRFECSGNGLVSLASGDVLVAAGESIIVANNGFSLTNAQVGSAGAPIHLQAQYGGFLTSVTTVIYGNLEGQSSPITLVGTTVNGTISTAGNISLTGGKVTGKVTSSSNTLTSNGTDLLGGAQANSGMNLSGGTLSGDFVMTSANNVILSGVTMTSGTISGANSVTASNSSLGTSASPVAISTTGAGPITLNDSQVYGNLTAPSYQHVYVNGSSSVTGSCLPDSVPAGACNAPPPAPVLSWHLNEELWYGLAGEVEDSSGNGLNGQARNGASTSDSNPALPAVDQLGTCRYGVFNRSRNQYLEAADNNLLDMRDSFTLGLWVRPASLGSDMALVAKEANYSLFLRSDGRLQWQWEGENYLWRPWVGYDRVLVSNRVLVANSWTHVSIRYRHGRQSLFINGQEDSYASYDEALRGGNSYSLRLGSYNNGNYPYSGALDELRIFNSDLTDGQVAQLMRERSQCGAALQCFTDNFDNRSSLGSDWVTSRSAGNFSPAIVNGRLRLTEASNNQSTALSLQRLLPARGNKVVVEFDYYGWSPQSGTGADGMAVILSDATYTPLAGAFGGSLGYAQKSGINGFAGGWLGVGLDEFGNYSNATEGRIGGPGSRADAVAVRGSGNGSDGYRYLTGTSTLNPAIDVRGTNTPAPGHRYRVTVDSTSANAVTVAVDRDSSGSGSNYSQLVAPYNVLTSLAQASLPENFLLSFTGSTGSVNNYHGFDNLKVCAAQINPIGQQIDHFELAYASSALTCNPSQVTIKACLNADCSQLYTDSVTASLSPSGNWSANPVTFSGGTAVVSFQQTTAATVTLGVPSSIPSTRAFGATQCRRDGGTPSSDCTLTAADSGFVFDVPDLIANKTATDILLKAVKKSDSSQKCVPAFANTDKSLGFWSSYIEQSGDTSPRVANWPVKVNNTELSASSANPTYLDLHFNNQGESSISVNYGDAGKVQLDALYRGSGLEAGLVMAGADSFVSSPAGLCISTQVSCLPADANCPIYRFAGESFPISITAMAWQAEGDSNFCDNTVTPSYDQGDLPLGLELVAPASGEAGTVLTKSYHHQKSPGASQSLEQAVSEVGIFRLTATPPPYQQSSFTMPVAKSADLGRFVPARVALTADSLSQQCGNFTYMGQPVTLAGTLSAQNLAGALTRNYQGSFAKGSLRFTSEFAGADQSARLADPLLTPSWGAGQALVNTQQQLDKLAAPDGPFSAVPLGVRFVDNEDHGANPYDRHTQIANADLPLSGAKSWGEPIASLRFGRALLEDASGPEDEALPIQLKTQYWNGRYYIGNTDDSCTQVAPGALSLVANPDGLATGPQGTGVALHAGQSPYGALALSAPGEPGQVTMAAAVADWLKFPWDPASTGQQDPQANGYFGRFRGNDKQIYWQEIWRQNSP
ncbi:DUF6701 domain-containing protein [Gallaecimonas xiamenensis]|uniref:MshQ n=1 Tax=Gallaecimonas xiamenensis 3-C-1 TaxID=745411 RepID=K2IYX2_9GAMM|nr:DUF6701 domain-containing protein [Gallaecimonas xiamenensis]EKE67732.1 MshQ [Gallaecimonas xiamenensis 3-C-1]